MAPDTLPNTLSWAERAACRGQELDLFFTDSKTGITAAKRICAACPVREECLAEALRAEDGSRYGVYGGLTKEERAELVDGPRTTGRKPAACGSRSAYQRHVKKGEPIDQACRDANAAASQRLRNSGSTRSRP
ncbi:WhiB family transcriptional regulator [Streptomyces sp. NPDC002513]